MLRALFLREFLRSWLIHTGLFATGFGMVTVVEYAYTGFLDSVLPPPGGLRTFVLVSFLVFSAFISGERCFSAAFKKGRYHFLLTMPAPRGSIWFAYTGGRLLGALAALPVVLPVRPALLRGLSSPALIASVLAMYLVYFFTGAALALAVRKEVLVYLLGFPILTGLIFLLSASSRWGADASIDVVKIPNFFFHISLGSLVLALVEAAWARRAFCRGELFLQRHNVRALAEGGLAFAAFAALTMIVSSNSSLAAFDDEWQPAAPAGFYPYDVHPVSPDGRFQFILQELRWRKHFKRLAVVDLKSGLLSSWFERPGLHQISWSPSGNELQVLATNNTLLDCLGTSCEGSTTSYRLTPDLQVLSAKKFKEPLGRSFPWTLETVKAQRPGSPRVGMIPEAASRKGFDRIVFEFVGSAVPGYRVGYIDPPAVQCRSGEPIEVAGAALLQVRLVAAKPITASSYETSPGLPVLQEMKSICGREANITWILGLAARNRFRVQELAEPPRLVIDIEHGR